MGIMRSIGQTVRAYSLFKEERLAQYGLSGNQSLYLRAILQHPGISQDELAAHLVFNKSSVSRQVAALEKAGLVRQERKDNDRRSLLVFPTQKGKLLLEPILSTSREFFSRITVDLSREEQSLLAELCEKVCRRAKEEVQEK